MAFSPKKASQPARAVFRLGANIFTPGDVFDKDIVAPASRSRIGRVRFALLKPPRLAEFSRDAVDRRATPEPEKPSILYLRRRGDEFVDAPLSLQKFGQRRPAQRPAAR
jgi:hypothetical protein